MMTDISDEWLTWDSTQGLHLPSTQAFHFLSVCWQGLYFIMSPETAQQSHTCHKYKIVCIIDSWSLKFFFESQWGKSWGWETPRGVKCVENLKWESWWFEVIRPNWDWTFKSAWLMWDYMVCWSCFNMVLLQSDLMMYQFLPRSHGSKLGLECFN